MFERGNRLTLVSLILFFTVFFYDGPHAVANRIEERHQPFLRTISLNTENPVFKDITVSKKNGKYLITGKVKGGKHSFCYRVEDGHDELVSDTVVPIESLSDATWSIFKIELTIETKKWPKNDEVFLILYHKDEAGHVFSDYQMVLPLSPTKKTS